jgi:DNA polymerase-3 subunit epsilon
MWQLHLKRLWYARRVAGTALQQSWQVPLPSTGSDWRQVSFLVVDAEMSSLDVREGELLSVGWVCVEGGSIALSSARHYLIRPEQSVGQSATIHSLRDCELEQAERREYVLLRFLEAAAGRVLVAHNAALDMAFLNRVCRRDFRAPVLMPVVDTMLLERRQLERRDQPIRQGDLRLQSCRNRYNLPPLPAHNALMDALATAELLVAMIKHRGGKRFPLGQLL